MESKLGGEMHVLLGFTSASSNSCRLLSISVLAPTVS